MRQPVAPASRRHPQRVLLGLRKALLPAAPRLALATILTACALAGCGGKTPAIKYYTVEMPAAPDATRATYPATLLIARVSAPVMLRDDRILYHTGANEMGAYEYHRWAEPPATLVEVCLLRQLRQSGKYASVEEASSKAGGDFLVHGRLYDFEEVDASAVAGRVAMEFDLHDRKAGKTVWSHFYSHDEPASGDDIPAVVAALNRNLQRGVQEVTASLDDYFAKNPPKP